LTQLRKDRDNEGVSSSLARLKSAAQGDENLMPVILDAVKSYATIGEICNVLREVFGEYKYRG
jgi:methylmalonyl-CoA mutase N-terminal domain/subunit